MLKSWNEVTRLAAEKYLTAVAGAGDASADNQVSGAQKTQIVDAGGDAVTVTGGKLDVNAVSTPPVAIVSTVNSSTSILTANSTFTGTAEEILNYPLVNVNVKASHASATDGLVIEFSSDGTNWDNNDRYTIPAATGKTFTSQRGGKYFRVRYTNGSVDQTYFRLETILSPVDAKPSSHRVQDTISDDDDGELQLAVLKLRTAQNTYVSGSATNAGNFKVSLEEWNGSIQTNGLPIQLPPGTINSFGQVMTGSINNQIDIQFYRSDGSVGDLVTETNANGGTATATNGMATFSATTTANSQAKGQTATTTTYTANSEIYCVFTAGFTGTGAGTSYQRIGLYNGTDGFFIGKEANSFGVSVIKGGAITTVAQASFNMDTLQGGADSLFLRDGTPEAVDFTKLNVWRIRFGWVGSAPVEFEVLSPDGRWVTFHQVKQPNNAAFPSINTADLPMICDVNSGNSGNALTIITNCWVAGTTQSLAKINSSITANNLAGLTRSVITGETTAGGGGFVNVKVNPSGTIETNALTDTQLRATPVPVSGTVTANQGGTWNVNNVSGTVSLPTGAATSALQTTGNTSLSTIAGAVSGTEMQVDVLTMPTTTVQATNLDIRDLTSTDVVTVTGGAGQTADVKVTLDGESVPVTGTFYQATQPVSATDLDIRNLASGTDSVTIVPSGTQTVSGTVTDGGAGKTLKTASFSLSATGTVVSAVATKRLKVYAVKLVCSAALSVNFRDGASTALEGAQAIAANGGFVEGINPPAFLFATSAGNSLDLVISGTGTAAGRVSYWDDDVS